MIASASQTHIARRGYAPVWYVSELPGHNHDGSRCVGSERNSDWGWTTERSQAIEIPPYWQRRFMADMRRVRREGRLETA